MSVPRKSLAAVGGETPDVDLDALRKAHADGKRSKTIRAGGDTYQVPSKLPIYVAVLLGEGEIRAALQLWLGERQEARFAMKVNPTDDELRDILATLYGIGSGESPASVAP
jgi:hypothetical protein